MRRVLLICCTLVLVFMMAVPSFAMEEPEFKYYVYTRFDNFDIGSASSVWATFPWPSNDIVRGTSTEFTYNSGMVSGTVTETNFSGISYLNTSFTCPADVIAFNSSEMFVTPANLIGENLSICINDVNGVNDDMWIKDVRYSFYVGIWEMGADGKEHVAYYPQDIEFAYDTYKVSIGEGLVSALYALDLGHDDSPYDAAFLYDVRIEVEFRNGTVNTPYVNVSVDNLKRTLPASNVATWYGNHVCYGEKEVIYETVYIDQDFDVGTFLADSVTAFLQTELFPGFTIDNIFYIILVLAIVLAFTKIMS